MGLARVVVDARAAAGNEERGAATSGTGDGVGGGGRLGIVEGLKELQQCAEALLVYSVRRHGDGGGEGAARSNQNTGCSRGTLLALLRAANASTGDESRVLFARFCGVACVPSLCTAAMIDAV